MSHAHLGIFGSTMSGKTTLAKSLARDYQAKGIPCIVYDPRLTPWGAGAYVTASVEQFRQTARLSRRCALFFDDGGRIQRGSKDDEWLFTESRHEGHRLHVTAQGGPQLTPTMRESLSAVCLFRCGRKVAAFWQEEFAVDDAGAAADLQQYEFLFVTRFPPRARRARVNFGGAGIQFVPPSAAECRQIPSANSRPLGGGEKKRPVKRQTLISQPLP